MRPWRQRWRGERGGLVMACLVVTPLLLVQLLVLVLVLVLVVLVLVLVLGLDLWRAAQRGASRSAC